MTKNMSGIPQAEILNIPVSSMALLQFEAVWIGTGFGLFLEEDGFHAVL
jgi:hypothetical protein